MPTTTARDQKLLVLGVKGTWTLVATVGAVAFRYGYEALDMCGGPCGYFDPPTAPGWHVWSGDIDCFPGDSGIGGNDPQDPAISWHGEWRPATAADLTMFGVPSLAEHAGDDPKDQAQRQAVGGPQPGEVYRHYKGGFYSIVARSVHEDTLEPLVTYHSNLKGTNWTRTLANFTESLNVDGVKIPRFIRYPD